ncbi:MAG: acyl-CoA thioester hydrolase/BAAT C-terminal domain-containing protein [Acetobacteraceae bacterium]|jgi:dienelactone hydrolase
MASIRETALGGTLQGALLEPARRSGLGVVVLGGSSGRVDVARATLFAALGATAIALRWFGGEGQVPGICEVPLETFAPATDRLVAAGCDRIAYVGTSKGAEAALLLACFDRRIDMVVAFSPSSVVWANIGPGRDGATWPPRSSWTRNGTPLPFVAHDPAWRPTHRDGLVAYRGQHEQSLVRFAADAAAAAIPAEQARAGIVLVAGGDDALWPSDAFAKSIADRLTAAGKPASLIVHPEAGHRVLLPDETTPRSETHAHGGSDRADRALGQAAWAEIARQLRLQG